MGDVVNLRLARKRRARADAERVAGERRAQFGQPKAETEAEAKRRELAARMLEGHRRDGADEP